MKRLAVSIFFGVLVLLLVDGAHGQLPITTKHNWKPPFAVREIEDNNIPFFGLATFTPAGSLIRYNLAKIRQFNVSQEAMIFLRVHEHGHIVLRSSVEAEVDCWAAKQLAASDPDVLAAAISWIEIVLGDVVVSGGITGRQQAAGLRQCAATSTQPNPNPVPTPLPSPNTSVETASLATGIPEFLEQSKRKFSSLKGERISADSGKETFRSKLLLENAEDCTVIYDRINPRSGGQVRCSFNFDEMSAARTFEAKLMEDLAKFVPETWTRKEDGYEEVISDRSSQIVIRRRGVRVIRNFNRVVLIFNGRDIV